MPTDLNGRPFQLTFVRPAQMMMFANVLCDPPLGQSTVIPVVRNDKVEFCVLIESSVSFPEQPWEAVIWHNCSENGDWTGLELKEKDIGKHVLPVSSKDRPKVYRRYFCGTITQFPQRPHYFEFTLKYRTELSQPWRWANDNSNLTNGEVIFQQTKLPQELRVLFPNISPSLSFQQVSSDTVGTVLWSITHEVPAASTKSAYETAPLGIPSDFTRWTALSRLWTPWLAPEHGKSVFNMARDGVTCSFLRRDGIHLALVAVSGVKNVLTVLRASDSGEVVVQSRNDEAESASGIVLAAVGYSHDTALAACMYYARKLVTGYETDAKPLVEADKHVNEDIGIQWYEEWFDRLTYCTWNALGQNLTEEKILNAIEDLAANDIHITNLIIDDNWQDLDNEGESQMVRGWIGFEANKKGFPDGLKETVSRIKRKQPRIRSIAVWHALLGYWGGISPDGELAKKYKIKEVQKAAIKTPGGWSHPGGTMFVIDEPDIQRMYNDFYDFLCSAGIDGVKTDAQFFLDLLDAPEDRRKFTKAYQDAWAISGLRHFSSRQISCMSLTPQIMFHSQLPSNRPRMMVRNSDDFFPAIPDSHPWHIFTNAHTSLLTTYLNVLPDWDMFQTSHEYSSFHAAGRCVSGGPIYFTDEPGKHDRDLIAQMTAKTTQNETVILRPSVIGKVIESDVYTSYEEERALKVATFNGHSGMGSSILGVFNASRRALSEFVNREDFAGNWRYGSCVVRAHTTGEVSIAEEGYPVASLYLQTKGWEILTAYRTTITKSYVLFAPLGLLGKMTGAAAILGYQWEELPDNRIKIATRLKALGVFGIYISVLAQKTVKDNFMVLLEGKPVPVTTVGKESETVLTIDIERARNEMVLNPNWGNEVNVDVYMS